MVANSLANPSTKNGRCLPTYNQASQFNSSDCAILAERECRSSNLLPEHEYLEYSRLRRLFASRRAIYQTSPMIAGGQSA